MPGRALCIINLNLRLSGDKITSESESQQLEGVPPACTRLFWGLVPLTLCVTNGSSQAILGKRG